MRGWKDHQTCLALEVLKCTPDLYVGCPGYLPAPGTISEGTCKPPGKWPGHVTLTDPPVQTFQSLRLPQKNLSIEWRVGGEESSFGKFYDKCCGRILSRLLTDNNNNIFKKEKKPLAGRFNYLEMM